MYYNAFAKFNNIKVLELDSNTTLNEVKDFVNSTTQQKYLDIHPGDEQGSFVIEFSEKEKAVLPVGSLIFSAFKELYYVLANDSEEFKEFFCIPEIENHFETKKQIYKKKLAKKLENSTKGKEATDEQFVCPVCNYIVNEPFEICPNCFADAKSANSLTECTDLNTKARKKKMAFDLDKIREEQCKDTTPAEVTAVYGDNVSVSNGKSDEKEQEKTTEGSNL